MSFGANSAAMTPGTSYQGDVNLAKAPIEKAVTIHELLNEQAKEIHAAHGVLDQLTERLASVLRAPLPSGAAVGSPAIEPMQISARIRDHSYGINGLSARMSDLVSRLEL